MAKDLDEVKKGTEGTKGTLKRKCPKKRGTMRMLRIEDISIIKRL